MKPPPLLRQQQDENALRNLPPLDDRPAGSPSPETCRARTRGAVLQPDDRRGAQKLHSFNVPPPAAGPIHGHAIIWELLGNIRYLIWGLRIVVSHRIGSGG